VIEYPGFEAAPFGRKPARVEADVGWIRCDHGGRYPRTRRGQPGGPPEPVVPDDGGPGPVPRGVGAHSPKTKSA
jgi:hypothetical protein